MVYPYQEGKNFNLKSHEFIGISPQQLNHLKYSEWNKYRKKLLVLQSVFFQNNEYDNIQNLLRAIDNKIILNELLKITSYISN